MSEEAFYYSYYDDILQGRGVSSVIFDDRSEHPDVINALARFNIYQEIVAAYCHKMFVHLNVFSVPEPFDFMMILIFGLSGIHLVGLMLIAQQIAGRGIRGILSTYAVAIWMGGLLLVT
eukprot:SAG31_NODE_21547_length_546_cov_2.228188_1_plen_118_part_10